MDKDKNSHFKVNRPTTETSLKGHQAKRINIKIHYILRHKSTAGYDQNT